MQCHNVMMYRLKAHKAQCPCDHHGLSHFQISLSLILLTFHIQNSRTYLQLAHSGILKQIQRISLQLQVPSVIDSCRFVIHRSGARPENIKEKMTKVYLSLY